MNLRLSLAGAAACLRGHPWIAADAQLSYRRPPKAGTLLKVQDPQGDFLGWALSEGPGRRPAFRLLSRERHAEFGEAWWQGVVERALGARGGRDFGPEPRRLLDGEADGVPGLRCDACCGQLFLSLGSPGLEPFLLLLERALADQVRPQGIWRRLEEGRGLWGPWSRSLLAPLASPLLEVREGPLARDLDLSADPWARVPPWPCERRSWRAWAHAEGPGRGILAVGALDGEVEALAPRAANLEHRPRGFFFVTDPGYRPERLLLYLPERDNASFGRFDALKHAHRLLRELGPMAEPGALWLLSSEHPSLAGAEAWDRVWKEAGVAATLVRVLGPEPDCPELPRFPEGRRPRAFVYQT